MQDYYRESECNLNTLNGIRFFRYPTMPFDCCAKAHIHSAVEMVFITDGSYRVLADNNEYLVNGGEVILFRSNVIHSIYSLNKTDGHYYVLQIDPSVILSLSAENSGASYLLQLALHNKNAKTVWSKYDSDALGLPSLLSRLVSESENFKFCSDIIMKICAAEITVKILQSINSQTQFPHQNEKEALVRQIYNAVIYINSHYSEDICAESLSKRLFLSYSYFSRSFKRITGKTFTDYLNTVRIAHADKRLMSTDKSITEIATECGFNSVSYFISLYKKQKGITPRMYRQNFCK